MRKNNYLVKEDIQRYNLVGKLILFGVRGSVSESRLRFLIDMDPVPLSLPCNLQQGNWYPMHWAAIQGDIQAFSLLVKVGMQYFPDKLGFVFCDGTTRSDNGTFFVGRPLNWRVSSTDKEQ